MLEQIIEFMTNHWILTSTWSGILIVLLLTEGARGGDQLSTSQVTRLINSEDAVVVDIRKKEEFRAGHLPNSINILAAGFANNLGQLEPYKNKPVIVVCKTGTTAGSIGVILKNAGFEKVSRLKGGIMEWQGNSLPLVKN